MEGLAHPGMYASVNRATISSYNGLLPYRRHAIIWRNVELLWENTIRNKLNELLIQIQWFSFQKIVFENIICKIVAILLSFNTWNHHVIGAQSCFVGCSVSLVVVYTLDHLSLDPFTYSMQFKS